MTLAGRVLVDDDLEANRKVLDGFETPQRIKASSTLCDARYRFENRGVIAVKGRGEMRTYFLLGRA